MASQDEQRTLPNFDLERFQQEVAEEIGIHLRPPARAQEESAEKTSEQPS